MTVVADAVGPVEPVGAAARRAVEVLDPGPFTTVQDHPGRIGYWHVGVPPSGPMDDLSFRIGNRVLGNPEGAPGLECTKAGPALRFPVGGRVCVAGAPAPDAAPRNADWLDAKQPLDARARAYLDINCGHCHSPKGPGNTSGLWLDAATREPLRLGRCKLPIAAGKGTGDRRHDIVPGQPDASILTYRMVSEDPSAMMPELGRSVVHDEGVQLVRDWIAAMQGTCDPGETAMADAPSAGVASK